MVDWIQYPFFAAICIGLLIMTFYVLVAMVRGLQLQLLEVKFRRQYSTRDFAGALLTLQQSLRHAPTGSMLYYQRAKVYAELGDYHAAEADYTHGMKFAQGASSYAGRAAVRLALGRNKEALIDANHAIACSRLWWRGYYERGRVYTALGHFAIALDDFNQSLELNRTPPPEIYLARAEAASHLGDADLAGKDRQRAAELARR